MKKILSLVICTVLLATALAGCGQSFNLGDINSGPGQLFDVDEHGEFALDGVDKITIITVSDDVLLQSGGEMATARLKGQCRSVTKPIWLDARKEGSTVIFEVKYPSTVNYNSATLTVAVPANFAGSISIGTVSGNVEAGNLPYELKQANLKTVSGEVNFSAASIGTVDASTTSGNITVKGITGETTVRTISGEIDLDYVTFARTNVTTVSGGVTAKIPAAAAFTVDFSTLSGNFTSNHANLSINSAEGGFNGSATGGDETIKVNTTSGNFRIEGKQ